MARFVIGITLAFASLGAFAQTNDILFLPNIPTLDDVGLGALIALVAAIGGWVVRRRK